MRSIPTMASLGIMARRTLRSIGEWLVRLSGPLPSACVVLRLRDGSPSGRRVRILNVRDVRQTDGFLVIEDLYGRCSMFRVEQVLSARPRDAVPIEDIQRGAVAIA